MKYYKLPHCSKQLVAYLEECLQSANWRTNGKYFGLNVPLGKKPTLLKHYKLHVEDLGSLAPMFWYFTLTLIKFSI